MKKYIDTHRYRYVSTISCNKKIEQKYGVRFARKDMPIFTNINEGRTGAKMWPWSHLAPKQLKIAPYKKMPRPVTVVVCLVLTCFQT